MRRDLSEEAVSPPEGGVPADEEAVSPRQGDVAAGEETERRAQDAEQRAREAEQRVEEAERRAEEAFRQLQRMRADFENFRRRLMLEQVRWQDQAVGALILELLPVLDNLERALAACRDETGGADGPVAALREGVAMVARQFQEVLGRAGVAPITAVGEPFDPERHEAVARTEEEGVERETVAEELQKGYLFKGQLLRPTLVRVAVPASPRGEETARRPERPATEGE